jgi:hypothetical protein
MKLRFFFLIASGCGAATTSEPVSKPQPAHSAVASASAIAIVDATPDVSPFQPAIDAEAAQRLVDQKWTDALVASDMQPHLAAPLSTIKRDATSRHAFGLALDSTLATVASNFTVGVHECEGFIVRRFCPSRTFMATLTPRSAPDDSVAITGLFADGKLYTVDATIALPSRTYKKEEDRVVVAAFDAFVTRVLGAPTSVRHNDPFMSDAAPYETTVTYGDDLLLTHTRGGAVVVRIVGKSVALNDALVKQDEAITQAEMARAAEAERKKLCTCAHMRIGDTWPHSRGNGMWHNDMQPRFRVVSVTPSTCTVRMEVLAGGAHNGQADHSCSEFVEPAPCNGCGRQ